MGQRFLAETWRIVPEFPKYEVSNLGRVRRLRSRRFLRFHGWHKWVYYGFGRVKSTGYMHVGKKAIHVMVASAFIGPRPPGKQINHKDGIKTNNTPENLEYVTPAENVRHAVRIGLMPNPNICRFCKQPKSNHKPNCFLVLTKRKLEKELASGAIKLPEVKKC